MATFQKIVGYHQVQNDNENTLLGRAPEWPAVRIIQRVSGGLPSPVNNLTFDQSWQAEILSARPLILPQRHFVYPKQAEEVERGALEVLITPGEGSPFLATCALGFNDPGAPTGIFSTPDPAWICAVSGGYAYLINTLAPEQFEQIPYRPVLEVRQLVEQNLLIFSSHYSLLAWKREGIVWQTGRLSSEGVEILSVDGSILHGRGWDMITDRDMDFSIDLKTGERIGSKS